MEEPELLRVSPWRLAVPPPPPRPPPTLTEPCVDFFYPLKSQAKNLQEEKVRGVFKSNGFVKVGQSSNI